MHSDLIDGVLDWVEDNINTSIFRLMLLKSWCGQRYFHNVIFDKVK